MANRDVALRYDSQGRPGKIEVVWSKPVASQLDLSLAYSPGVAAPCREIVKNPDAVDLYTARRNLVAVVTNGTAVLGLGDIGPRAAKPVMEGKAVLFKRFADIDVFDLELDAADPEQFIQIVSALEPTFGGINLEDIKAPDCFIIERALRKQMKIPVFHDDQHGTAIISAAAVFNAVELQNKSLESLRVTCLGAGAAATSCMELWVRFGVQREHITMVDQHGILFEGRDDLDEFRSVFARPSSDPRRTLDEALDGADVLIGLSAGNIVTGAMLKKMAKAPIVFALANPDPEISYEKAVAARPDAIVAANDRLAGVLRGLAAELPPMCRPQRPDPVLRAAAGRVPDGARTVDRLYRLAGETPAGMRAGQDLMHTDLSAANVLLDDHGRATGIVDWNLGAFRGDRDFALITMRFDRQWFVRRPDAPPSERASADRLDRVVTDRIAPEALRVYWAQWCLHQLRRTLKRGADDLDWQLAFAADRLESAR